MKLSFFIIVCACMFPMCKVAKTKASNNLPAVIDTSKASVENKTSLASIKGVAVDSHGRALDTDGDGVPDYKDKELLTQLICFPVDSTGVGICPEPWCCQVDYFIIDPTPTCKIGSVEIVFAPKSKVLTLAAKKLLDILANQMKANPGCEVRFGNGSSTKKAAIELSWQRINAVIRFLVEEKGISEERLSLDLHLGDENIVELYGTNEVGPNSIPTPHPNRRQ